MGCKSMECCNLFRPVRSSGVKCLAGASRPLGTLFVPLAEMSQFARFLLLCVVQSHEFADSFPT